MSRDIRFRIYDKKRKSYIGDETGFTLQSLLLAPCDGAEDKISDYIFEQDTGLVDKNGKKIFEGDIVKFQMYDGEYENYRIVFRDAAFDAINADDSNFISYEVWNKGDVIGNIHEDPDLLNAA